MTCAPREDSDQTAYSQSLVSRLDESLLDTLLVNKDQKVKRTATLISYNWLSTMCPANTCKNFMKLYEYAGWSESSLDLLVI